MLASIPVLWFAWWIIGTAFSVHESVKQARAFHRGLQESNVFTPAALTLARMCQAGVTKEYERLTNLVPSLKSEMGDCWGNINPNGASMEFGGGFWHFGYELQRDDSKFSAETNYWILTMYTEGETNRTLLTFSLPASETNFQSLTE
jgi:hypothetical protein